MSNLDQYLDTIHGYVQSVSAFSSVKKMVTIMCALYDSIVPLHLVLMGT